MKRLSAILIVTAPLIVSRAVEGADFHVAPNGDDAHAGTESKPFATLERARDEVRKLKQAGPLTEPITVFVPSREPRWIVQYSRKVVRSPTIRCASSRPVVERSWGT